MLNRIQRTQNELIKNVTDNNSKRAWKTRTRNLMKDYTPTDISNLKPHQAKQVINAAAKYMCTSNMIENGILKSKVEFLLLNTNQYNPITPSYLTELNRCEQPHLQGLRENRRNPTTRPTRMSSLPQR